jgi:hypothetical protein
VVIFEMAMLLSLHRTLRTLGILLSRLQLLLSLPRLPLALYSLCSLQSILDIQLGLLHPRYSTGSLIDHSCSLLHLMIMQIA